MSWPHPGWTVASSSSCLSVSLPPPGPPRTSSSRLLSEPRGQITIETGGRERGVLKILGALVSGFVVVWLLVKAVLWAARALIHLAIAVIPFVLVTGGVLLGAAILLVEPFGLVFLGPLALAWIRLNANVANNRRRGGDDVVRNEELSA